MKVCKQKCPIIQYFDLLPTWIYCHKLWWTGNGGILGCDWVCFLNWTVQVVSILMENKVYQTRLSSFQFNVHLQVFGFSFLLCWSWLSVSVHFAVSTVRMKVELDPHIFLSDWLMMLMLHIISRNWHYAV